MKHKIRLSKQEMAVYRNLRALYRLIVDSVAVAKHVGMQNGSYDPDDVVLVANCAATTRAAILNIRARGRQRANDIASELSGNDYETRLDNGSHPMQPIALDAQGVARFKKNRIVELLLDDGKYDMNKLQLIGFSIEDREQFAQLTGYSVSGFGELSYVRRETAAAADAMVELLFK